jgi:hypothetical protein
VCITLDVFLGPLFFDSWTNANGNPMTGIASPVPLIVSVAMTGLQYALFDRLAVALDQKGVGGKTSAMIVVVAILVVADTIVDVGGYTAWRFSDAEAANIVPPNWDWQWLVGAIGVALLCAAHEAMMQSLLARFKGSQADKSYRGAALIKGGVRAGGLTLNLAKSVGLVSGAVSLFVIDLILLPQMGTSGSSTFWMWVGSFGFTGIQVMLWQRIETVGKRRSKKRSHKLDRVYIGLAWSVAVFDTFGDVIGFTTAVYGDGTAVVVVPEQPTWVWGLGVVIVAALCFAGERLFREMLWRPGKEDDDAASSSWFPSKAKAKSKSDGDGWGSDWDAGWGDDDAGAKKKDKKSKDEDDWGSGGDWI